MGNGISRQYTSAPTFEAWRTVEDTRHPSEVPWDSSTGGATPTGGARCRENIPWEFHLFGELPVMQPGEVYLKLCRGTKRDTF